MTETNLSTCPWCGCPERPDSILNPITCRADWACWSFQHGAEPRQSIECERNVLGKEVERLRTIIIRALAYLYRATLADEPYSNKELLRCAVVTLNTTKRTANIVTAPTSLIEAGQKAMREAAEAVKGGE